MSVRELTENISPAFTKETVLKILKVKTGLSEIQILEISFEDSNSKKGDSFLSTICRFRVKGSGKNCKGEFEECTVPVIVKIFPKNDTRKKTFRSADFFKTEIQFYENVWSEMIKFKHSKNIDEPDEAPLLLASYCDGKNDFIALEDLSYYGFTTYPRSAEMSKEFVLLFLKVLANFHGIAIALREAKPEFAEIAKNIDESYYAEKYKSWYENFLYKSMGPQFQKAAKDLLSQEYYDKITKLFAGDYYGQLIKGCKVFNKFSVVTQGDAWIPNFLIKNEEDGAKNAVIIDFQLARYTTLVNDLLHYLFSCVPNQMLLNEWDDLIANYLEFLNSRIEKLGGPKNYITIEELHEEIRQNGIVGVGMAMESGMMTLLRDDELIDIDKLEGDVPLENVWILPKFEEDRNEKLAFLVKLFVDKGLI